MRDSDGVIAVEVTQSWGAVETTYYGAVSRAVLGTSNKNGYSDEYGSNYDTNFSGPNGEDLNNGSADYEHHGNAEDFSSWLSKGLELYEKAE